MLDNERNRTTSYRVRIHHNYEEPLTCSIITYPQLVRHHAFGIPATVTGVFRYDALPQWMTDGMKMLDTAAVDGSADIPDFGTMSKDTYWFMADQTK